MPVHACSLLIACHLGEIKTLQELGNSNARVLMSSGEDTACKCRLAKVLSCFLTDFAFEAGIDGNQKASLAFVNMGSCIVQGDGEELRERQMNMNCTTVNMHILRIKLSEVNAGNGLPMD